MADLKALADRLAQMGARSDDPIDEYDQDSRDLRLAARLCRALAEPDKATVEAAGSARTAGLIDYPSTGSLTLTEAGRAVAPPPDTSITFHDQLRSTLTGPQRIAFDQLLAAGTELTREGLCERVGWEPTSGHVKNVLGSMRTLELVEYPRPGAVVLQDWVMA